MSAYCDLAPRCELCYDYVNRHPKAMVGWANAMMTRDELEYRFIFVERECTTIPCVDSVMGCVGIYFGNLEFQLCGVKNHASV